MLHLKLLSEFFESGSFPEDAFHIHKVFFGHKIIVYGAGESFHYFKEVIIRQYGYTPSVILDRKFRPEDSYEGIPAFSPSDYVPSSEDQKDAVVVVCLGNKNYHAEAWEMLRKMGFVNIISLGDIYEIHNPFNLPRQLKSEEFRYYLNQRSQIESCLDLFADELSKDVYTSCLQTHLTRKPVVIPASPREEQYTPRDFFLHQPYSRFIYCGVSVGEMASIFSRIGTIEELVCFEPDPNQFRLAADFLVDHHESVAERVTALPCAVYSHEGIKPFTYSDTSFGSRILEVGTSWTQAVTIDRILPDFRPTIIIMDIEGAELEGLQGAVQTIRSNRPDLAICVYHSPTHLWEIPLYLHSLGLGYRFYLRNYTSLIFESVLYATVLEPKTELES
jgi:FkbM family methyltransferase